MLIVGMAFCIDVGVVWVIFWICVRSASCKSFRCVATVLDVMLWDRFDVAVMMASA